MGGGDMITIFDLPDIIEKYGSVNDYLAYLEGENK